MQHPLINRIHRLQGQLSALESAILEQENCKDVMIRFKTIKRAMQSLSAAYVEDHMRQCMEEGRTVADIHEDLSQVLHTLSSS